MEWFKHSTGSHDDPDISDAMDELGHAAYTVFFIILELYGQEYNHADKDGWITFSKSFLKRKTRLPFLKNSKTLEQTWSDIGVDTPKSRSYFGVILEYFRRKGRFEWTETPDSIIIRVPKFIEISSNWTKRKSDSPTEVLQSAYRVPTAIEEEEKKKKNRIEEYTIPFLSFWDSYPRKSGSKKAAFDAWKKIGSDLPSVDIILSSIMVQKGWRKNANGEFRPEWKDPERWLKNRMWESDFKTEVKKAIGVPKEDFLKCLKCGTRTFRGDLNEAGVCLKCEGTE
jgi:hypothetical protein